MVKVFLSSVSAGLEQDRAQLVNSLRQGNFDVVNMEAFGARPQPPLDVCLQELRKADVVVVIVGPRYGSLVPDEDFSYTHAEFREAQGCGIPVLAFVLLPSDVPDNEEKERLNLFRSEAGSALTYKETRRSSLAADILASLYSAKDRGELGLSYRMFQPYDRFFSLELQHERLLNHMGAFVGRGKELEELLALAPSKERLLVLSAPGGSGKSRLLLEFAKRQQSLDANSQKVLFVDPSVEWTPDDIRSLPAHPPILIFDDAHRRGDLDRLARACVQQNESARLIVSCRPSAIDAVQSILREFITEGSPPRQIDLPPLAESDSIKLAESCLGEPFAHLAGALVHLADGNPLVISVGARCIATSLVQPDLLARSPEEFRRTVLDHLLRDPVFEEPGTRSLLELVAAIGPVHAEDQELRTRIAEFMSISTDQVVHGLGRLERGGFLQRRGRLVRVMPDVLADHLLYQRAVSAVGSATGYVDRVFERFSDRFLENILGNAAELDWRATAAGERAEVLSNVWQAVDRSLPSLTNAQRRQLLGRLHRAARFTPIRVLEVVEWLADNTEAPEDTGLTASGFEDDHTQVDEAVCRLLGFIAGHPDYTTRCLRRLWAYAERDLRPTNPYPRHPRRVLAELMEYDAHNNLEVQSATLDFVGARLLGSAKRDPLPWAVALLGKPLERVLTWTTSTKESFTYGSRPLAPFFHKIRQLRQTATERTYQLALGRFPEEAIAAVSELAKLLRRPEGMFDQTSTPEEDAIWLPEACHAAGLLRVLANEAAREVVRYAARRELRSASRGHWPELAPTLESETTEARALPSESIFDALVGAPWEEELDDWKAEEERRRGLLQHAAEALWAIRKTPDGVAAFLLTGAEQLRPLIGEHWDAWPLVLALVKARKDHAPALAHVFADNATQPGPKLAANVLEALYLLGEQDAALAIVQQYAHSPHEHLRVNVAGTLRSLLRQGRPADLALLHPFLQDASLLVRSAAVRALVDFKDSVPEEAIALLVGLEWQSDLELAEAAIGVLHTQYGLDPSRLADEQIDALLHKVVTLPSLDGRRHDVLKFVEFASTRRPGQTIDMLLERIRNSDQHASSGRADRWTPIPYNAHGLSLPGVSSSENSIELLRRIRDSMQDASPIVRFWLPHLFRVASSNVAAAIGVLDEWLFSNEPQRIIDTASLTRGFDHTFVFSAHEFIARALENARKNDEDSYQHVRSVFFGIANGGVVSSAPGEPAPRYLADSSEASNLATRYADRPAVKMFYDHLAAYAKERIRSDGEEFEEADFQ